MYFISQARHNQKTGQDDRYYRLKESYRDVLGKVHSYILLNVGFIEGLQSFEIGQVAKGLTYMSEHLDNETLLGGRLSQYSPIVQKHIRKYWKQIEDAGISSEENLQLIKDMGYNYLCVSRTTASSVRSN